MKKIVKLSAAAMFLLVLVVAQLKAQGPPPGRGPGGFDPDEMVKREKQNVFKSITDLNDDQKLLLDGIYDEFAASFKELRDEMMEKRDFQAMKPKMQALQAEKDGLIRDVLNADQYIIYEGIVEQRRAQRSNQNLQRGNAGNKPQQGSGNRPTKQADDTDSIPEQQ